MARAAAFVFLPSLLLLSLSLLCDATQGEGEVVAAACRATDLVVRQRATGRVVEGKPEYAVEVANRCRCAQSRVLLRCYGLSSVESVDPHAIRPVDDERCVLHGGRPIRRGAPPVRFTYAWMTPFDFPLISSQRLIHFSTARVRSTARLSVASSLQVAATDPQHHPSTCKVYDKTIGSFVPSDHPFRKVIDDFSVL
ncbi:hypothetical protein E2562_026132 [Oryza meyeriana var. granulata]|uniref:Uncharacterized protein n=1 Tax=Oryza meyeriana var. granulata TaxID=110450 RepID=A0A6G1FCH9_9ORYZ|nr:hypothetical protein E2562_026132 [Oryza meyeriana var. granulata]